MTMGDLGYILFGAAIIALSVWINVQQYGDKIAW